MSDQAAGGYLTLRGHHPAHRGRRRTARSDDVVDESAPPLRWLVAMMLGTVVGAGLTTNPGPLRGAPAGRRDPPISLNSAGRPWRRRREHSKNPNAAGQAVWVNARAWGVT